MRVDCSAVGLNRAADLVMKNSFAFSNFYRMSVQVVFVFVYDMAYCLQCSTASRALKFDKKTRV